MLNKNNNLNSINNACLQQKLNPQSSSSSAQKTSSPPPKTKKNNTFNLSNKKEISSRVLELITTTNNEKIKSTLQELTRIYESGYDVNTPLNQKYHALHLAKNPQVIKLILAQKNVTINPATPSGKTPLHKVIRQNTILNADLIDKMIALLENPYTNVIQPSVKKGITTTLPLYAVKGLMSYIHPEIREIVEHTNSNYIQNTNYDPQSLKKKTAILEKLYTAHILMLKNLANQENHTDPQYQIKYPPFTFSEINETLTYIKKKISNLESSIRGCNRIFESIQKTEARLINGNPVKYNYMKRFFEKQKSETSRALENDEYKSKELSVIKKAISQELEKNKHSEKAKYYIACSQEIYCDIRENCIEN